MNKQSKIIKFIHRLIETAENRLFQTASLAIISLLSLVFFVLARIQRNLGFWFLLLLIFSLCNLIFINSNKRKLIVVGNFLSLLLIICSAILIISGIIFFEILSFI